jgi:DNA adenine methylase
LPVIGLLTFKTKRLVDVFCGGGNVFLNADAEEIWINDINSRLINFYRNLKLSPDALIQESKKLFSTECNNRKTFDLLKEEFHVAENTIRNADIFFYLNRHCFRGLYRENSSGKFNVPFGDYKNPAFPEQSLRHMSSKLQTTKITNLDFKDVLKQLKPGDVVYADPPYIGATFAYHEKRFARKDHEELILALSELKLPCVLNNSFDDELNEMVIDGGGKVFVFHFNSRIETGISKEIIGWWI